MNTTIQVTLENGHPALLNWDTVMWANEGPGGVKASSIQHTDGTGYFVQDTLAAIRAALIGA